MIALGIQPGLNYLELTCNKAQQAAENAQGTDQSTQTSENTQSTDQSTQTSETAQSADKFTQTAENVAKVEPGITNGQYDQQMDGSADPLGADLEDLEFEKRETRRLIREGRVTINHYYYMSKTPEAKPEQVPNQEPPQETVQNPVQDTVQNPVKNPVQTPVQTPVPIPVQIPVQNPAQDPVQKPRNNTFAQAQRRIVCTRCNKWYFEKDNVLQEDGRGPCYIHPGMFRPSREAMTLSLTLCHDSF